MSILSTARSKALDDGVGLTQGEIEEVLRLPDAEIPALLELAHETRLRWCGEEVEIEGIISLKTGGCPEDCHFCSQSGLFESPVRAVWLDIEKLVESAKHTAKTGATEFCIVAAVKGPDERLMQQLESAVAAIRAEVDIQVAASVGTLTKPQVRRLARAGIHRYNHNLETARSFFPQVVTTHTWEERRATLDLVREAGMEVCSGGILGMGETLAQRAEFAVQLAQVEPAEVPMNFLDPRPGTPFADYPVMDSRDALRAVGAFRLAMPHTTLRFAGGRELTLGSRGAEQGLLGGINAMIVGNYLTTLGRPMEEDLDMMGKIQLPIKALNSAV
ncbi:MULTISPECIES: biotin synthase BioB [unclassified Corynebacterium]|uniref:biotin synthase BioB n=1 Tax=unclassified Corynebacterium TaxID=2624378 RepID=UPI0029C9BB2F|nr:MULTISPECIES: biotin synthase BioB [unclassified Corynebacterium]WPF65910.1 biotin synthase BioB [Corynebacterium sp. 22KM0430]WPF68403.1 biotin synthase BioB [Corynebacterium sp. 21KM1197]